MIQLRLDGAPAPLSDGAALNVHLPTMLEVLLSRLLDRWAEDALARIEIGFDSKAPKTGLFVTSLQLANINKSIGYSRPTTPTQ